MIIKSYVAESASAALKQVRSELGGDAVVLKTRRIANKRGGYDVEVTACHDKPTVAQTSTILSVKQPAGNKRIAAPVWARAESTTKRTIPTPTPIEESPFATLNAKLDRLLSQSTGAVTSESAVVGFLRDTDLPLELHARIVAECNGLPELEQWITTEIRNRIDSSLDFAAGDRVVVIGPSGAGKTAVIGKLAAALVAKRTKVTILGVNQTKVGAIDELQSLSDLIGVAARTESTGVAHTSDSTAVTLIDAGDITIASTELAALNPTHTILVASALTRTSDLATIALRTSTLGITHLILTMLDQTHRIGGLFAACDITGAKLAFVNESPSGMGLLQAPDPAGLTAHLMSCGGTDVAR